MSPRDAQPSFQWASGLTLCQHMVRYMRAVWRGRGSGGGGGDDHDAAAGAEGPAHALYTPCQWPALGRAPCVGRDLDCRFILHMPRCKQDAVRDGVACALMLITTVGVAASAEHWCAYVSKESGKITWHTGPRPMAVHSIAYNARRDSQQGPADHDGRERLMAGILARHRHQTHRDPRETVQNAPQR